MIRATAVPEWMQMWSTAVAIYVACKVLSWSVRTVHAPVWKHVAYLIIWPGMNADRFLQRSSHPVRKPHWPEWFFAVTKFLFGVILIYGIVPEMSGFGNVAQGWAGMIGLVFVLHFGLFHLLSCGFRAVGIEADPLMDWPLCATSVAEFWGQRWNRAFRDLTHRFLFRPFRKSLGPTGALLSGFLVSGFIHEMVITVPTGSGYGLPTIYFALQAGGLLFERSRWGKYLGLGRGWRGWMLTLTVIALPIPLLFPMPFVLRVMVPFCIAIGALP